MRRRGILRALGLGAAVPFAAGAQSAKASAVVGVLSPFSIAASAEWHAAFEAGLRQLGWLKGGNLDIKYRFAGGATERLPAFAAELVSQKVDVIVSEVTEASWAAQKATSTLPIVMVAVGDPVAAGLVGNLERPGGNITGLSQNIIESASKRMEMLKLMVPDLVDVAVLWNPDDDNSTLNWREVQGSSRRLGLNLTSLPAHDAEELNKILKSGGNAAWRALYVVPGPLFVTNLQTIADVARERRVASIFHLPEFVHMGGLLSYGPDRSDLFRQAAVYVDKILKGARPADLPVEQPTKFAFSVNLANARILGLAVPPLLLAQTDELVE